MKKRTNFPSGKRTIHQEQLENKGQANNIIEETQFHREWEQSQAELEKNIEQIRVLEDSRTSLQNELDAAKSQYEEITFQNEKLQAAVETLKDKNESLENTIMQYSEERKELEEKIIHSSNKEQELQNEIEQLKEEIVRLKEERELFIEKDNLMKHELATRLETEINTYNQKAAEGLQIIHQLEKEIESLQKELTRLKVEE
ncbi:hypothetical protein [Halobacillus sp. Marseille-Q1614]|uniref:hypothetical protein n=1 Tax=Halobacillus sp. Marseille-Q1614 TaxID=2709134 RepID=UPI00156E3C7F|nr:hypothetical protein [Halobacillus sp. Marseille-Q1614]